MLLFWKEKKRERERERERGKTPLKAKTQHRSQMDNNLALHYCDVSQQKNKVFGKREHNLK